MVSPVIDYTSKDFDGFRQSMLDYAEVAYPEWTGRSRADFGVTLVELFALMGDILSYYNDRVAAEAFLPTATQRISVLAHAAMLGYTPYGSIPSTGTVTFQTDAVQGTPVVIPAGTQVTTDYIDSYDASVVFETVAEATVPASGGTVTADIIQGVTQGSISKILNAGASSQANILVEQIGTSDGTLDQVFRLPNAPVIDGSVRLFLDDTASANPNAVVESLRVPSLLSTDPTSRVFSVSYDETGATLVSLGDNVNGAVPTSGVRLWAIYRVGGGTRGNLSSNTVKALVNAVVGVSVSGSSETVGGTDPESNDSIRINAPRAFRSQNRAVTLSDYADLALAVPSVSKARAVSSGVGSVVVYIVGPAGAAPTATLTQEVQTALDERAMVSTSVDVEAGSKVFINVGTSAAPLRVGVYRHFATTDIKAAVESAIADLFSTARTSLGQRLPASAVYAAASAIPGVAYVVLPMMARSTDAQTGVNDILCREWEFPVLGTLNVTAEAAQE